MGPIWEQCSKDAARHARCVGGEEGLGCLEPCGLDSAGAVHKCPFASSRAIVSICADIHSARSSFLARADDNADSDQPLQTTFADSLVQMTNAIKNFGTRDATQL
eukprot:8832428-Pyramimonas_sp.AAC.1